MNPSTASVWRADRLTKREEGGIDRVDGGAARSSRLGERDATDGA